MLKHLYFTAMLLCSVVSFAQIKATIIDSKTKEPVPYVNIAVEGKNINFNADEGGSFTLPETAEFKEVKTIHLSAVGYTNTAVDIASIKNTIMLSPAVIVLDEVVIEGVKSEKTVVVNPIKKAKKTFWGAGGGTNGSLLYGCYIPFLESYTATPYIKNIKLRVDARNDGNTFAIRLQSVDEDGSPGEYLHNDYIVIKVEPKDKYADIDLSKSPIRIPEEGLFIVVEHIAIKANRLGGYDSEDKFPAHLYAYGPTILCEYSDIISWHYKNGKWNKNTRAPEGYSRMITELTLTD